MADTFFNPGRHIAAQIGSGMLEHVNLTVSDTAATARMLMDLFGWQVRWEEDHPRGGHVIHVGSATGYIALYQPQTTASAPFGHRKAAPLNHVGVQVEDLQAAEQRVLAAGLKPFNHSQYQPGPDSFYFFDRDGIEWEVVAYAG
jgi:catechol 2,3-dioxygenase-like lactoylglutathione lyase family enzyme